MLAAAAEPGPLPCETQAEIDGVGAGLTDGGRPGPCGWLADPDHERVRRVTQYFLGLDTEPSSVADLQAAYDGTSSRGDRH